MALYSNSGTIQTPAGVDVRYDQGLRSYMLRVYNYMASGLLLSGVVAVTVFYTGLGSLLFTTENGYLTYTGLGWVIGLAPLLMLIVLMFTESKLSATGAQIFYWTFVALMGASLTMWLYRYTGTSIVRVFFITAVAFTSLSIWGYTTKRDLSGWGKFLLMALIGLILTFIVNIFMQSTWVHYVACAAAVLIFAGFTAYDTQAARERYYAVRGTGLETKVAIFSALDLYLDFILLMKYLLFFLGDRS